MNQFCSYLWRKSSRLTYLDQFSCRSDHRRAELADLHCRKTENQWLKLISGCLVPLTLNTASLQANTLAVIQVQCFVRIILCIQRYLLITRGTTIHIIFFKQYRIRSEHYLFMKITEIIECLTCCPSMCAAIFSYSCPEWNRATAPVHLRGSCLVVGNVVLSVKRTPTKRDKLQVAAAGGGINKMGSSRAVFV